MTEEEVSNLATVIAEKVAEKVPVCRVFDTDEIQMVHTLNRDRKTIRRIGLFVVVGLVTTAFCGAVWAGFCALVTTGRLPKI